MIQHVIKSYRYKTETEKAEYTDNRVTKDVMCKMETYYMNATEEQPKRGRRMIKVRFHNGNWYHMPARALVGALRELDFKVEDLRV